MEGRRRDEKDCGKFFLMPIQSNPTMLIVSFGILASFFLGVNSRHSVDRGYTWLSDTKLKAGKFYETSKKWHVFAVDENTVIYGVKECFHDTISTIPYTHKNSPDAKKLLVREVMVYNESYNNFDPAVGAALAKRLMGKAIPYNRNNCNKYTYRRYFLHGKAVWRNCVYQFVHGGLAKGCPLARELHGLTIEDVQDPDFVLLDDDWREYRVSDFPPYKKYDKIYGDGNEPMPISPSPSSRGGSEGF